MNWLSIIQSKAVQAIAGLAAIIAAIAGIFLAGKREGRQAVKYDAAKGRLQSIDKARKIENETESRGADRNRSILLDRVLKRKRD